ncbi:DNA polymerase III subunit alpha, partial [Patescibacteria group bacterium]|nr:DNA polymerase III subunit alpha [Patescibacteria group bacterium]
MMSKFIHLHTHSHYSLLTALPKINDLIEAAKKRKMPSLALTDNGNLYGAIEFYKACNKENIKPIIGIDAYVAQRTRHDKEAGVDNRRTRLVLLAKGEEGYKNLIQLVTKSHLEGFYYKPRVDHELLKQYRSDLIAIIPSFSGETTFALKASDENKAKEIVTLYKKIFGKENVYLEITHHPEIEGHENLMGRIVKLSKESVTPLVAAHDVYYIDPKDKRARETLLKIQTNTDLGSDRSADRNEDFSFIDSSQAEAFFKSTPEALENTLKIAAQCNLKLELGKWVFPNFKIKKGHSYDEELKSIVYKNIEKKGLKKTPEVVERIEYELKIIKDKGYSSYFLVVSDLLRYAHEHNILTTTRGSVAGSIVSYLSEITNVDPLEYKLPFERFLYPERPSAPDIDMDIADNRRDEMIQYAKDKYGEDKVAQIGTFGTMMARGVVRDVARALGYPYGTGDQIARLIPFGSQGFPMTINQAMDMTPELKELYKKDADVKDIIELARQLEGNARHISIHAAGVVIAPVALTNFVPVQFDPKGGKIVTQYDMYSIEDAGLLKFDFLGIKNLSILSDSVQRAKERHNVDIDIENIPLDNKKTYEMLSRGDTMGLFQLGGSGMTRYIKELKPSSIHDINAMVALYRPGPMEVIPEYIRRKNNPE